MKKRWREFLMRNLVKTVASMSNELVGLVVSEAVIRYQDYLVRQGIDLRNWTIDVDAMLNFLEKDK